jgi:hypothetical protein
VDLHLLLLAGFTGAPKFLTFATRTAVAESLSRHSGDDGTAIPLCPPRVAGTFSLRSLSRTGLR